MEDLSLWSRITLYILIALFALLGLVLFIWQIKVLRGDRLENPDGSADSWREQETHFGIAFADIAITTPCLMAGLVMVFLAVGTQLVAHGFNFPRVTLVGVMDADGPLLYPDFRAAERAFQTVTQVAGRAGRAMVTGDVLIQTRHPDHYALQHALQMDALGFAAAELKFREEFAYPPYARLVQVQTASKKEKEAWKDMESLLDWGSGLKLSHPAAVGPSDDDGRGTIGMLGPTRAKRQREGHLRYQLLCYH